MNRHEKFKGLISGNKCHMVDFQASNETENRLKNFFKITKEVELLDILESDFYYLSCRDISQNESYMKCYKKKLNISESKRICPLGILWIRGAYDSKFSVDEALEGPLYNISSENDILSYKYPDPADFDFDILVKEVEEVKNRLIIGGLWSGIMGDSYRMYGFQKFMTDIACSPNLVHVLVDKITEVYIKLNEKYFETMKGKMDIWFFGNDFGSQMGLLLSLDMWYDFFYENIRTMCNLAHSYGFTVMMHSCGGIKPIIPHLINAGVDILDPVQTTAKGMKPETLASEYGSRIIFHGGLDTQSLLPFGTPAEVISERNRFIKIFTENGGYILAPAQVLDKDVPLENILAIYNINSS